MAPKSGTKRERALRVYLIRHGDPNYEQDCLTVQGTLQALQLADALQRDRITEVHASTHGRAIDTARPLAQKMGLPLQKHDWLRELDGRFTTVYEEEWDNYAWDRPGVENLLSKRLDPKWMPHMEPQQRRLTKDFNAFLQGYELDTMPQRNVYGAVGPSRETLAIFCHSGVIRTLLSSLFSWRLPLLYSHLRCPHASFTKIDWVIHEGHAVPKAHCICQTIDFRP